MTKRPLRCSHQLLEVGLVVDGLPAGEELEEDDPVAVDVGLLVEARGAGVLGVDVADGPHDVGGGVGLGHAEAPRYAEVREVGLHVLVQEDVRRLHVPVDDAGAAVMVQVGQPLRRPQRYPQPGLPVQLLPLRRPCGDHPQKKNRMKKRVHLE